MLKPGDKVLVALSGGPDSVALLLALHELSRKLNITLLCLYLNHRIRPGAAKKESEFCRKLCAKLGVECFVEERDVPAIAKRARKSIEEAARDVRYAVLEKFASDNNVDKVVLGHHRNDQVETILFRLIRGTGPDGIAGMPYVRGIFIRPLLDVTKAELLEFLRTRRQKFCTDSSNASIVHQRNFIRRKIIPLLERLNPRVSDALLSFADLVKSDNQFVNEFSVGVCRKTVTRTPGDKFVLDLLELQPYADTVRRRVFRYVLQELSKDRLPSTRESVEIMLKAARDESKKVSLPGGVVAERRRSKLYVWRAHSSAITELLEVPGEVLVQALKTVVKAEREQREKVKFRFVPRGKSVSLDYEKVRLPLKVGGISRGERFQPLGMSGQKKIGDYLTDRKVPVPMRNEILVVSDQEGVVWLAGYEIADRVKIDKNTKVILTLAYRVSP